MKMGTGLMWLILILVLAMACEADDESLTGAKGEQEVEAIKALMEDYVSGYESQDPDNFEKVFTSDAVRMPPNAPSIVGSRAIRTYYREWFERETLDVVVVPSEIQVAGEWAYAWGTYEAKVTLAGNGDSKQDDGKWLNIYKKGEDGAWRFHRNIWNSNLPFSAGQEPED